MYEIIIYDTADGKCPVQDLLDSMEHKYSEKTGILVSNISAISNKKGITTGNERLRYLFYVKLKIVSPDLPKLQFYRYAAGVRLFEREALWRQPVPYNDEGC